LGRLLARAEAGYGRRVLEVGKRYESSRGTVIEIVSRDGDRMSFERSYAPDTGRADPHYHLDFTQTWEGLEGNGRIEVDGEERQFAAGDRVSIRAGTAHRDPWNPDDGKLKVRGTFDPTTPFIEAYAEAWAHHLRENTSNDQDEIPLLQILAIARETDGKSYRAGVPRALQRATLPLVAAVARLRGFKTRYDR
jgi:mannose-6-phosphate isomerase-like protein (cupin superfamily)